MKCVKCKKEMEKSSDTSFGRGEKEYSRTIYVCKEDDIWVTIEIPKKEIN